MAREVADDLVARGYVDDAAFARQWVATRAARGHGPTRLAAELRARGVSADLIAAALAGSDPQGYLERARAAARTRLAALRRSAPDRVARRLRDHLLRLGHDPAVVATVVRELTGRGEDD